ncbi:hypothetical protein C4J95_4381 [Pseudomonas orientalis]|uniref:DUF2059 domain-containing protein n=1 Tax=Pseudomonas orientalis TaxID=76758 RepID=UPI000F5646C1|nr:DUF2059 domain-containing protein [Pseudomonas orientalis]AZF01812.1 hypothetical protein C4J95_4381 [Pseudomonas orientalis]
MAGPSRSEIIIAVIGLVGVIVTALASNWDKISSVGNNSSNSPITSDDINVQLRYYVDSTGLRTSMESLEKTRAERYRLQYKADPDTVNCMLDMGLQSSQLIDIAVNALKGHFTLEEIKELNHINASPFMKRVAEKQPAISLDLVKGLEEALERTHRRNVALAGKRRDSGKQSTTCPAG